MTEKERKDQEERIKAFDKLVAAENDLTAALQTLAQRPEFTGDTSRVQRIKQIMFVSEYGETIRLDFNAVVVTGYQLREVLAPMLDKRRDRIWKHKEEL